MQYKGEQYKITLAKLIYLCLDTALRVLMSEQQSDKPT